jgi:hypothetical protein
MMTLTEAAGYFNNTEFLDAYDNSISILGRVAAYDDNSRDSLSTDRRIITVSPGTVIPTRRVVTFAGGTAWIVGELTEDYHGEAQLRNKYVLHKVSGLATVKAFDEALLGEAGKTLFAGKLWVKDVKESEESSDVFGTYHIYVSSYEDIRDPDFANGTFHDGREKNVLINLQGKWFIVRDSFESAGGFTVAVTDELPDPVVIDVDFITYTRNRVTETNTPTTNSIKAINLRWQSHFSYPDLYSVDFKRGDAQILILKDDVTPSAGSTVALSGRPFKVVSILDNGKVWSVHLRHD